MRIIFDQATPVPIRPFLKHHAVRTAAQQGWDRLRNDDLLTAAEDAGFDLLLTTDKKYRGFRDAEAFAAAITAARRADRQNKEVAKWFDFTNSVQ